MLQTTGRNAILLLRGSTTMINRRTMATIENPRQWRGHYRWLKGSGSEAIGSLVSNRLKASGIACKEMGIEEMRQAKEQSDKIVENRMKNIKGSIPLTVEGQSQNTLGRMTGCEGLKERGERKIRVAGTRMWTGGPGDGDFGSGV